MVSSHLFCARFREFLNNQPITQYCCHRSSLILSEWPSMAGAKCRRVSETNAGEIDMDCCVYASGCQTSRCNSWNGWKRPSWWGSFLFYTFNTILFSSTSEMKLETRERFPFRTRAKKVLSFLSTTFMQTTFNSCGCLKVVYVSLRVLLECACIGIYYLQTDMIV